MTGVQLALYKAILGKDATLQEALSDMPAKIAEILRRSKASVPRAECKDGVTTYQLYELPPNPRKTSD